MSNAALIEELKSLIIEALNLEDVTPADIETDAPLFNEVLGFEFIDALEFFLAFIKKYGIIISAESEDNKKHFASVAALADFVAANRA